MCINTDKKGAERLMRKINRVISAALCGLLALVGVVGMNPSKATATEESETPIITKLADRSIYNCEVGGYSALAYSLGAVCQEKNNPTSFIFYFTDGTSVKLTDTNCKALAYAKEQMELDSTARVFGYVWNNEDHIVEFVLEYNKVEQDNGVGFDAGIAYVNNRGKYATSHKGYLSEPDPTMKPSAYVENVEHNDFDFEGQKCTMYAIDNRIGKVWRGFGDYAGEYDIIDYVTGQVILQKTHQFRSYNCVGSKESKMYFFEMDDGVYRVSYTNQVLDTEIPKMAGTDTPETPTEKPTEAPTEAPTVKPTEAPTVKPTEAPTQKPTEIATTEQATTELATTETATTEAVTEEATTEASIDVSEEPTDPTVDETVEDVTNESQSDKAPVKQDTLVLVDKDSNTGYSGNVLIQGSAPEGVIPKDSVFEFKLPDTNSAEVKEALKKLSSIVPADKLSGAVVWEIDLYSAEGSKIQPQGGTVSITVPLPNEFVADHVKIYCVDAEHEPTLVTAEYSGNKVTFEAPHFSYYIFVNDANVAKKSTGMPGFVYAIIAVTVVAIGVGAFLEIKRRKETSDKE